MSTRLETIADLVPEGARVADIGTDHARLLPLLLLRRRATFAIGIDRDEGPLLAARRTLARIDPLLLPRIELRHGDGLAPLQPGEVDAVVIAGMGARSIIAILERHPDRIWTAGPATTLVLQPLTEIPRLRTWLVAHDLAIVDERITHERSRARVVLVVRTPCADAT
jgi:tRNA (adenine22-N1)-methyltransferase